MLKFKFSHPYDTRNVLTCNQRIRSLRGIVALLSGPLLPSVHHTVVHIFVVAAKILSQCLSTHIRKYKDFQNLSVIYFLSLIKARGRANMRRTKIKGDSKEVSAQLENTKGKLKWRSMTAVLDTVSRTKRSQATQDIPHECETNSTKKIKKIMNDDLQ